LFLKAQYWAINEALLNDIPRPDYYKSLALSPFVRETLVEAILGTVIADTSASHSNDPRPLIFSES